jgi:hypothetical protein
MRICPTETRIGIVLQEGMWRSVSFKRAPGKQNTMVQVERGSVGQEWEECEIFHIFKIQTIIPGKSNK